MKVRLDAVQPLMARLVAELPPALTITGLSPGSPVVWLGTPGQICFRLPPSGNFNPKSLVLFVGDGSSSSYYPNALGAANQPLSTDYQGCTPFTVSPGIVVGNYSILLLDNVRGTSVASVSFVTAKATVAFVSCSPGKSVLMLTASWSVDSGHASAMDVIKVHNAKGDVVFWFFTSCRCQGTPGPTSVLSGNMKVKILKLNSVPGGYTIKFYPGGREAIAAVGKDWIPWTKLGW